MTVRVKQVGEEIEVVVDAENAFFMGRFNYINLRPNGMRLFADNEYRFDIGLRRNRGEREWLLTLKTGENMRQSSGIMISVDDSLVLALYDLAYHTDGVKTTYDDDYDHDDFKQKLAQYDT